MADSRIGGRENVASLLVIFGIVFLVLAPLSVLIGVVVGQAISVSQSVTPWVQSFINEPTPDHRVPAETALL